MIKFSSLSFIAFILMTIHLNIKNSMNKISLKQNNNNNKYYYLYSFLFLYLNIFIYLKIFYI